MPRKSPVQLDREIAEALSRPSGEMERQPFYGLRIVPSERAGYVPGKYVVQYKDRNGMWFDIGDPKSKDRADAVLKVEKHRVVTKKRAHATMKDATTRYAVVPSQGRYGSGERVRAARVFGDRTEALKAAAKMTREFQAGMKPYGGSSGGYRAVETDARTSRDARWLGHELDRMPSLR